MLYRLSADLVVALHLCFVLFVLFGGLLLLKWPRLAWLHVPAVIWGAFVEFSGWICPLTPLENWLRVQAGETGYAGDFLAQYFSTILYPEWLTRDIQFVLGALVVVINLGTYTWLWRVKRSHNRLQSRHNKQRALNDTADKQTRTSTESGDTHTR